MQFSRESLLSANHFGFFHGRLAAAGGRRLPEPALGENEDARGRGGSCGASAARTTHHYREHRRLLGRGAEHVHSRYRKEWRFIGNSSPSSRPKSMLVVAVNAAPAGGAELQTTQLRSTICARRP